MNPVQTKTHATGDRWTNDVGGEIVVTEVTDNQVTYILPTGIAATLSRKAFDALARNHLTRVES